MLMVSVHHLAEASTCVWSHVAVAFASIEPFDSLLYAIDVYGYSLMSLSTLFAAPVFRNKGLERWIRWALIANGCLVPFLALQMYWPALIWGGSLWAITFPAASWLLAVHFGRMRAH